MSEFPKIPKDLLYGDDVMRPLESGVKSFPTPLPDSREEAEDPDEEDEEDEEGGKDSIFEIKRTPGTVSGEMRRRIVEVSGRDVIVFEIPKRRRY